MGVFQLSDQLDYLFVVLSGFVLDEGGGRGGSAASCHGCREREVRLSNVVYMGQVRRGRGMEGEGGVEKNNRMGTYSMCMG